MRPKNIPKKAISTLFRLYEYKGMPFGMQNVAKTFQRGTHFTRGIPYVYAYSHDLITSCSYHEHEHHFRLLLKRPADYELLANVKMCIFGFFELEFLDYAVTSLEFVHLFLGSRRCTTSYIQQNELYGNFKPLLFSTANIYPTTRFSFDQ